MSSEESSGDFQGLLENATLTEADLYIAGIWLSSGADGQ